MKQSLVVALFLVAGAPAYAGAGLKLPYVAPTKGLIKTETAEQSIDGVLVVGGKRAPMQNALKETFTEEIVTVDGDVITEEKLTVAAAHRTVNVQGQHQDFDLSIAGKSYVVTTAGGKVTITGDGGKAVEPIEESLLEPIVHDLGKPDSFGKLMASKTFVKGQKMTISADELAAVMGANDLRASGVSFTLTAQDATTATFALAGTLSGPQDGMDMTITFKGTAKVDVATSRPLGMAMTGRFKGSGDMGGKKVEMTGTLASRRSATYK